MFNKKEQQQEIWNWVCETKGNFQAVALQLNLDKDYIANEALNIFVGSLRIINNILGEKENEIIFNNIGIQEMLSAIIQSQRNPYYSSAKNLSTIMSMIQCVLYQNDVKEQLIQFSKQIKIENIFFEIKKLAGRNIENIQEESKKIIIVKNNENISQFEDIYIKLDINNIIDTNQKQDFINSEEYLEKLNQILKEFPYWEQIITRSNLMDAVFNS